MKYNVTYACGHTGTVDLFGKTKDREQKIAWLEKSCECPECEAIKRKELIAEQEKQSIESCLPILTGSEKQIVWASEIRRKLLDDLESLRDSAKDHAQSDAELQNAISLIDNVYSYLTSQGKAHWWIDNRYNDISYFIVETKKRLDKSVDTCESISAEAEATVIPKDQKHEVIVEINVSETGVEIRAEKDDTLRSVVKEFGYRWDGDKRCWAKTVDQFSGTVSDRAAEIGNKLLNEGFPVVIYDAEIRTKAISADFELECSRWIKLRVSGKYEGYLSISWRGKDQNLYDSARKIHGARWDNPNIVVPISNYQEVEDFADIMNFEISPGAAKAIAVYKASLNTGVTPKPPAQYDLPDKLGAILQSSDDILPSLKDD